MSSKNKNAVVYVVSDSAGETGEFAVRAAAAQFYPVNVEIRRTPFIETEQAICDVIERAKQLNALIVFTLVVPHLRDYLIQQAQKENVPTIDLLGPIISVLENDLGKESQHMPGLVHKLDADYFKKVDAVEFAVRYDDGREPKGILKADIVLVGVSRTSKTPLSMYLAHKKFKVANVPLVPELQLPDELFTVSKKKIVGLTIKPEKLNVIRKERLKALGLASNATYANVDRIVKELEFAEEIMKKLNCEVIDVTNKAVEETASLILDMFNKRG